MVRIDDIAVAALHADGLHLRSLVQDWLTENVEIGACLPPVSGDIKLESIAAGLVELFALRRKQTPPLWASKICHAHEPIYLVKSVATMPRLRQLCADESPEPLRRRNLFAPPTFLEYA